MAVIAGIDELRDAVAAAAIQPFDFRRGRR